MEDSVGDVFGIFGIVFPFTIKNVVNAATVKIIAKIMKNVLFSILLLSLGILNSFIKNSFIKNIFVNFVWRG